MLSRRRHRRPHSDPHPLDRLYNYCNICKHSWDQATRPTCTCYPGSESWNIQFLSSIPAFVPAFDMSPRHTDSPPLKHDQPMIPPVEAEEPRTSSHRTHRKPAYKWYDRTWALPSPILHHPNEITLPPPPPPPPQSYPAYPMVVQNSQWQSPVTYGTPVYYLQAATPAPTRYPDPKISARSEPGRHKHRSSSSSRYNMLPPASISYPAIETPIPDPRIPFMYRKRDNYGYR